MEEFLCLDFYIQGLNKLPNEVFSELNKEKLYELKVQENNLKSLPEDIGLLNNLHVLNADSNYIESLPDSIGKLSKLEYLSLQSNSLIALPNSMKNLKKLSQLSLQNNNFSYLDESLCHLLEKNNALLEISHNNFFEINDCAFLNLNYYLKDNHVIKIGESDDVLSNDYLNHCIKKNSKPNMNFAAALATKESKSKLNLNGINVYNIVSDVFDENKKLELILNSMPRISSLKRKIFEKSKLILLKNAKDEINTHLFRDYFPFRQYCINMFNELNSFEKETSTGYQKIINPDIEQMGLIEKIKEFGIASSLEFSHWRQKYELNEADIDGFNEERIIQVSEDMNFLAKF